MNKIVKGMIAMGFALGMANSAFSAEALKLGYLVKQPEEPWFQTEWNFADKAGKDLGFEVIKIAVPDGEKTLNAIDSLAANGAKGFVICTPDPKLGAAIMAKANSMDLKVITVDDQFVNAKGQPMEQVPLVMMAATKIGERQGQELYKEMQKRQWDVKATGVLAITADELDTARRRVEGSLGALKAAGFPEGQIFRAPGQAEVLRRIAREIACDQIAFETSKVRQELLIDAGLAIDGRHLGPELARLDRQSAGQLVQFMKRTFDVLETPNQMSLGIAFFRGCAETVVQVDTLRRDHPQQRREPLVPDLSSPLADQIVCRRALLKLEVDGQRRRAAPQCVRNKNAAVARGLRLSPQPKAGRGSPVRQVAGSGEHLFQRGSVHALLRIASGGNGNAAWLGVGTIGSMCC